MIEIDAMDSVSLKNASEEELKSTFFKFDRYFDFGPKLHKPQYRQRLGNILQELRARKKRRLVRLQGLEPSTL